jgi:RNA recognition motif-containing protein
MSVIRLFVGNVPHSIDESGLKQWFEEQGYVVGESPRSAQIVRDRVTGHSRGFGFIELVTEETEKVVSSKLNGMRLAGRVLTINGAHPRTPRGDGIRGGGGDGVDRERSAQSHGNRYDD